MTVDTEELDGLRDAVEKYRTATRAWERRVAHELYRAYATPDLVGALADEYIAAAPTTAELDESARRLREVADTLEAFGVQEPETAGIVAVISISGDNLRRNRNMAFILQTGQQVELTAGFQDRHGNAAQVESQTWTSSDEAVVAVTDNGDGTATARAETLGTAQVQLSADARFGDETSEITGVLDVEVVASEAVTAVITPGTPTDTGAAGGATDTGTATGGTTDEPTAG